MQHTNTNEDTLEEHSDVALLGTPRVVIISGMSGSGKSTAMRALEDVGFFCIDNLPLPLLPKVLALASQRGEGRAEQPFAFVVDTRDRDFLVDFEVVVSKMLLEGVRVQILFLDADDDTLVRRYSETRRRHPMSDGGTVREGIDRERAALMHVRKMATLLIDSTEHTVHTLKTRVQELCSLSTEPALTVTLLSFGFKHGVPTECDLVFDVRFLPNPYFVEGLRERTGEDQDVFDYVLSFPEAGQLLAHLQQMMEFMLPLYVREGKSYLTMGVGCTGGKHRSVSIIRAMCSRLRGRGWHVSMRHRDVHVVTSH